MVVKSLSWEDEGAGMGRMTLLERWGNRDQYTCWFTMNNATSFWRGWQGGSQDPSPRLYSWTTAYIPELKLLTKNSEKHRKSRYLGRSLVSVLKTGCPHLQVMYISFLNLLPLGIPGMTLRQAGAHKAVGAFPYMHRQLNQWRHSSCRVWALWFAFLVFKHW